MAAPHDHATGTIDRTLRRRRSLSDQHEISPGLQDSSIHTSPTEATFDKMPSQDRVVRSVSLSTMRTFERVRSESRLRITYQDDALCRDSLANVSRLIRAAKTKDNEAMQSNSARLAKKALRYRRLLQRAEEVDIDDPNFDMSAFLQVTWCKAAPPTTA